MITSPNRITFESPTDDWIKFLGLHELWLVLLNHRPTKCPWKTCLLEVLSLFPTWFCNDNTIQKIKCVTRQGTQRILYGKKIWLVNNMLSWQQPLGCIFEISKHKLIEQNMTFPINRSKTEFLSTNVRVKVRLCWFQKIQHTADYLTLNSRTNFFPNILRVNVTFDTFDFLKCNLLTITMSSGESLKRRITVHQDTCLSWAGP